MAIHSKRHATCSIAYVVCFFSTFLITKDRGTIYVVSPIARHRRLKWQKAILLRLAFTLEFICIVR
ncbi:MAG: hypothetical protein SWL02_18450, partial [Pseudomonadota bacterium]|nr:hypothetical protein [Pseudomonadota bacterium]